MKKAALEYSFKSFGHKNNLYISIYLFANFKSQVYFLAKEKEIRLREKLYYMLYYAVLLKYRVPITIGEAFERENDI